MWKAFNNKKEKGVFLFLFCFCYYPPKKIIYKIGKAKNAKKNMPCSKINAGMFRRQYLPTKLSAYSSIAFITSLLSGNTPGAKTATNLPSSLIRYF